MASKSKAINIKPQINKSKHLSLEDRIIIESSLNAGLSFKEIAVIIGKDPCTISKEVKTLNLRRISADDIMLTPHLLY